MKLNLWKYQRTIAAIVLISFSAELFVGCGTRMFVPTNKAKKYNYVYQLVEPANLTKLEYRDSQISISFSIDDAAISYTIINLSTNSLLVESGSAMIGIDSVYSPVRNILSLYADNVKGFAPMDLPARSSLSDIVIPRNNIFWGGDGWVEKDLFLTNDSGTVANQKRITRNIGKKLELILPVKVGEKSTKYVFRFKVAAINLVPPESPIAEKKRPPAPRLYNGNVDPWILVGVPTGIALFSALILFSSKKPVGPLN